jgi:sensor histidine kinase regulating citrate/malate metabolism
VLHREVEAVVIGNGHSLYLCHPSEARIGHARLQTYKPGRARTRRAMGVLVVEKASLVKAVIA